MTEVVSTSVDTTPRRSVRQGEQRAFQPVAHITGQQRQVVWVERHEVVHDDLA